MSFALFILVNATLFIRPMEIVPELQGLPIYNYLILACLALSVPEVLHYFSKGRLASKTITVCVLGILLAIFFPIAAGAIAQAAHVSLGEVVGGAMADVDLHLDDAFENFFAFAKVVIYYLLLVSLLRTGVRMRVFIRWIVIFCFVLSIVTVLQYHEIIHLSTLKSLQEHEVDPNTIEQITYHRLQGSGIFQDPNELCVLLACVTPLCLFAFASARNIFFRCLWLSELLIFAYAIQRTASRGGFLALMAGLGVLCLNRFGWRKSLALGAFGLPVLLVLFGGRQTDLSTNVGTGQSRIQLWSDWFTEFKSAPLFGVGIPAPKDPNDDGAPAIVTAVTNTDHLAHNSYLQSFAYLGVFGGTFFLGAFALSVITLSRLRWPQTFILDPGQRQLQPYLLGSITAFTVGLFSLSLCYVVPTYLVLGLAAAFPSVSAATPPPALPQFSLRLYSRLLAGSAVFLIGIYVFIRVFIRWA